MNYIIKYILSFGSILALILLAGYSKNTFIFFLILPIIAYIAFKYNDESWTPFVSKKDQNCLPDNYVQTIASTSKAVMAEAVIERPKAESVNLNNREIIDLVAFMSTCAMVDGHCLRLNNVSFTNETESRKSTFSGILKGVVDPTGLPCVSHDKDGKKYPNSCTVAIFGQDAEYINESIDITPGHDLLLGTKEQIFGQVYRRANGSIAFIAIRLADLNGDYAWEAKMFTPNTYTSTCNIDSNSNIKKTESKFNSSKTTISGKSFSEYAKDHPTAWHDTIGTEVYHPTKGKGHILRVLPRQNYIPLIDIEFSNGTSLFNSESFYKCDISLIIDTSLATHIFEWENEEKEKEERERHKIEHQRIIKEKEEQERQEIERQRIIKEKEDLERTKKARIIEIFSKHQVQSLWHMTHRDNICGILKNGIMNHYDAHRLHTVRVDISDPEVQRWRDYIEPFYNRKIHEYAPLYIKPRNPMLYVRRNFQDNICLIEISLSVLAYHKYIITDGNAASRATKLFNSVENIDNLPWDVLNGKYWPDYDDGKRKMCAEVLIFPSINPKFIENIHCFSNNTQLFLSEHSCNAVMSPQLYF